VVVVTKLGQLPVPKTHIPARTEDHERTLKLTKEIGKLMIGKPATEGPVNGNLNYNGSNISEFLVRSTWLMDSGQVCYIKKTCELIKEERLMKQSKENISSRQLSHVHKTDDTRKKVGGST
jgi:hypothetical protein